MEVPNEVRIIMEKLDKMIISWGSVEIFKTGKIFKEKSGLCWYNYFSGENIFDHAGKKGYCMFSTVRFDRLPKLVPEQYMHKKGTEPRNLVAKCSRFNDPIVMV